MDKQRICKICNRRFANGKAMGGHMRSHLAKLPLPPKPNMPVVVVESSATRRFPLTSSSMSLQSSKDLMQTSATTTQYHHRSVVVVSESETESPRSNTTRRRSARRRRVVAPLQQPPPPPTMVVTVPDSVSSIIENFSVEEVALCLLKLSRDRWPSKGKQVVKYVEVEDDEDEDEDEDEEDEEEEEGLFCVTGGGGDEDGGFKRNGKRFKCEKCLKCFPTYQSLGGHKASHKKIKRRDGYVHLKPKYSYNNNNNNNGLEEESTTSTIGGVGGGGGGGGSQKIQKNFECQFCDKVFESGQALGGHKKVHFSYVTSSPKRPAAKSSEHFNIDLNLPAPEEDSEVSQV